MWFWALIGVSWLLFKAWYHKKERKLLVGLCCSAIYDNSKLRQEWREVIERHAKWKDGTLYIEGGGGMKRKAENQLLVDLITEVIRETDRR